VAVSHNTTLHQTSPHQTSTTMASLLLSRGSVHLSAEIIDNIVGWSVRQGKDSDGCNIATGRQFRQSIIRAYDAAVTDPRKPKLVKFL
jgi:hypothetical protein